MAFLLRLNPERRSRVPDRHTGARPWRVIQPFNESRSGSAVYFGGGGVKISRLEGSGFGFGLGAFLVSFLPLSLFPMQDSMTQKTAAEKCRLMLHPGPALHDFGHKLMARAFNKLQQVAGVAFHRQRSSPAPAARAIHVVMAGNVSHAS
jgi:hypothetical protein